MQNSSTIRLYSLNYSDVRTYLTAAMFIVGNIVLPQLVHMIPQGGLTWLPIYFFTLVGSYKYGWKVGLLTALASPALNSFFFGMPSVQALPAIILKSVLLALTAGYAARRLKRATLMILAAVVLSYQSLGTLGEWAMKDDFYLAVQDFRIGIPGMLVQIFGGWLCLNRLLSK